MSGTVASPVAELLSEDLSAGAGYFIRPGKLLEAGQSSYQAYEVWDTPQFGKLFRLDGCFMTSERDEFYYHENLIHVTAVTHPEPRKALIIGGGDGGSAAQLLKHPSMRRIVLVELDACVVEIARRHLQTVHKGALDDARLELRIEDGLNYVGSIATARTERFDLIVLDLTDPVGPAEALYDLPFLTACKALLSDRGAISLHLGAPFFQPERVRGLIHNLRAVFHKVSPYFMYIPLYGSQWSMACASDHLEPPALTAAEIDRRLLERRIAGLQYYNGAVHCAQFAQPNFLRTLLA